MLNKIKCIVGFHNWKPTIPSERICKRCKLTQSRVIYPFLSSVIFWENKTIK